MFFRKLLTDSMTARLRSISLSYKSIILFFIFFFALVTSIISFFRSFSNSFPNISFVSESITASFLSSTIVDNQMEFETVEPPHEIFTCFCIFTKNTMIMYSAVITYFQRGGINKRYSRVLVKTCFYSVSYKWDKCEFHNFYKSVVTYKVRKIFRIRTQIGCTQFYLKNYCNSDDFSV